MLLRFRVFDPGGKPATNLEPYMGMAGHLVIVRANVLMPSSPFSGLKGWGPLKLWALVLRGFCIFGSKPKDLGNV